MWSRVTAVLYRPADSGTASSMATPDGSAVGREVVAAVSWVRTAIIPQPMSTPTAAGMIAPSVGMTTADRGALAEVGVGHERDVGVDERQPGRG